MHGGQRSKSGVFLNLSTFFIRSPCLSLKLEFTGSARAEGQQARVSPQPPVSVSSAYSWQEHALHPTFKWMLGSELGSSHLLSPSSRALLEYFWSMGLIYRCGTCRCRGPAVPQRWRDQAWQAARWVWVTCLECLVSLYDGILQESELHRSTLEPNSRFVFVFFS